LFYKILINKIFESNLVLYFFNFDFNLLVR